jgi:LmbE family N-acetylglucosaminyl deacetylase
MRLGVIRTNELLKGRRVLWRQASFGAPKWTSAFQRLKRNRLPAGAHERVLYDAVLAVRRERPQIIVSTFVGGISDGHGQHQVSGEIAQEAFKAAGDPNSLPRAA